MTNETKGLTPENFALVSRANCGLAINGERFLLTWEEMEAVLNTARQEERAALAAKAAPEGWRPDDAFVDRVATAAMVCVTPHLKHMISFNNLWIAVRDAAISPRSLIEDARIMAAEAGCLSEIDALLAAPADGVADV